MPSEEDQATATGNMHKKFGAELYQIFWYQIWYSSAMQFSSYATGQTDQQTQANTKTDMLITILCNPTRAK